MDKMASGQGKNYSGLKIITGLIQKLFYYQIVEIIIVSLICSIRIFLTLPPWNP